MSPPSLPAVKPSLIVESGGVIRCVGCWKLGSIDAMDEALVNINWPVAQTMVCDVSDISAMDTAGAWLLQRSLRALQANKCNISMSGMRPEFETLLAVMQTVQLIPPELAPHAHLNFLGKLGYVSWPHVLQARGMLAFFGEFVLASLHSLRHPGLIRWRPILYNLQHAGFNALPIVGLLAFLMGVVIAFQGAAQLQRYGANIFIADMIGLSILRELAPLMTAIIVAGRSGSAFAAQIGTMKVTEEIDALRTIGVAPMELLVLPKVIALLIALPLLTVYADIMGVLGGMLMARSQLGVSFEDFLDRFDLAIRLSHYMVGLGKAPVFAMIVVIVGCYQGFNVGNRADSVGKQTTTSVVQAIFLIIVADAIFSVVFNQLNI
jgi:phospholipid/cholesterol/gamma-HCH transport system permease protein